jgi:hypothetical protein
MMCYVTDRGAQRTNRMGTENKGEQGGLIHEKRHSLGRR